MNVLVMQNVWSSHRQVPRLEFFSGGAAQVVAVRKELVAEGWKMVTGEDDSSSDGGDDYF